MNAEGIALAFFSLAVVAAYHPLVVAAEYRFSKRVWPFFALCGAGGLAGGIFLPGAWGAALAFWGAVNLWCVFEVRAQAKRVEKGWFPRGPGHRP